MKIVLAKNDGFCPGVKAAVNTAMKQDAGTYVLGEIIHNESVVRELEERGLTTVDLLSEVPDGATVIFRSHGVPGKYYDECAERGIKVVDCTCRFVRHTQEIVRDEHGKNRAVIIAGDRNHPEVIGLLGWCDGDAYVADSETCDFSMFRDRDVSIVSQTTFSKSKFDAIIKAVRNICEKSVEVFETICYTTINRQRETEKMAEQCEAMIVIGGLNSSNTNKLCEIAERHCGNVFRLSDASVLDVAQMKKFKSIGIVSGASTPKSQTREVCSKMEEKDTEVIAAETENTEGAENTAVEASVAEETAAAEAVEEKVTAEAAPAENVPAEEAPAEEAAPVADEKAEENKAGYAEDMSAKSEAGTKNTDSQNPDSMAGFLAKMDSESHFKKNQIVTATISKATEDGLQILLPFSKKEIALNKADLDCETYDPAAYEARIGETIDLLVVDPHSPIKLSEKMIRLLKEEESRIEELKSGKEFQVTVTGSNKGGLTGEYGTFSVFIPAKEIRMGYVQDLTKYIGKTLRLRAIEIKTDSRKKEIIASQRVIFEEEQKERDAQRAEREEKFFESVAVDDIVDGKVERITNFGAFVSVKGFDCLCHISDISWSGCKKVDDYLKIGSTYKFKVLKIDRESKKVSIGYKQLQAQPWDTVAETMKVGDTVHGKVVRFMPFGAFVKIMDGVDALVHISQISNERIDSASSVLNIGDEVYAKIIALDVANRKMNLSIKALLPEEERKPRAPRKERETSEGDTQDAARDNSGKGARKGSPRPAQKRDDDEITEWNDSASLSSGMSIAELLGSQNKKDGDK